jgi:pSer/pThr/pTyr-binding forkhead associated (FHA) protein
MIRVTVSKDGEVVKRWNLAKDEIIVGRGGEADVQLATEAVSRRHARISRAGEKWQVADLGAANGVYLAKGGAEPERVVIAEIAPEDRIHIEQFVLQLEELSEAEAANVEIDESSFDAEDSFGSKRTQFISMTDVLAARDEALKGGSPDVSGPILKVVKKDGEVTETQAPAATQGAWAVELTSDSGHKRRFELAKDVALVGSAQRCDVQLPIGPGTLVELERSGQSVSLKRLPLWPFPRVLVEGRPVRRSFIADGDVIAVGEFELTVHLVG